MRFHNDSDMRVLVLVLCVLATFVIFNCSGKGLKRQVSPGKEEEEPLPPIIALDKEAPTISIVEPVGGAVISERQLKIVAEAEAVDDKKIVKVVFYDGDSLLGEDADGADGWRWDLEIRYPERDYILKAVAYDDSETMGESARIRATTDLPTFLTSLNGSLLNSALQGSDNNFYLAGAFTNVDTSVLRARPWLLKIGEKGGVIWQKRIENYYGTITSIDQSPSGEKSALALIQLRYCRDMVLEFGKIAIFGYDNDSAITWQKFLGGIRHIRYGMHEQVGDGGYIVSAQTIDFGRSNFGDAVIRLTPDGNQVWARMLNCPCVIDRIGATADGGYMFVGMASVVLGDASLQNRGLVLKLDSGGNLVWRKMYTDSSFDVVFNQIIPTADGGGYVVGSRTGAVRLPEEDEEGLLFRNIDDIVFMKFSADGSLVFGKIIDGLIKLGGAAGGVVTEGGVILSVSSEDDLPMLMKLDEDGNALWLRSYGIADSSFMSIIGMDDGGMLVSGMSISGDPFKSVIVRAGPEGKIDGSCSDNPVVLGGINIISAPFTEGTIDITVTDISGDIIIENGDMTVRNTIIAPEQICPGSD